MLPKLILFYFCHKNHMKLWCLTKREINVAGRVSGAAGAGSAACAEHRAPLCTIATTRQMQHPPHFYEGFLTGVRWKDVAAGSREGTSASHTLHSVSHQGRRKPAAFYRLLSAFAQLISARAGGGWGVTATCCLRS